MGFYLPNNPKNQHFEKIKKVPEDITILQKSTKNHDHMLYCSLHMTGDGCNCYFSFWVIFPLLPSPLPAIHSLRVPKIKMKKKWKKYVEISSFYTCVPKITVRWCIVRYGARRTDGRTDRQKKWHIEVSHSPKKCYKLTENWKYLFIFQVLRKETALEYSKSLKH